MSTHVLSRRSFVLGALGVSALALAGCGGASSGEAAGDGATTDAASSADIAAPETSGPAASSVSGDLAEFATGTHHASMDIEGFGTIKLELFADEAPVTVANFAKLVSGGFYDGLTFHRIIRGFMMQGGDPTGTGRGGSDQTIVGEFAANGHANSIKHVRGSISMARSSDPDSASSQFFIMQEDAASLDGQYAAFGHVTEGIEVVDAICDSAKPTDNNGTIPAAAQPKISSVVMVD